MWVNTEQGLGGRLGTCPYCNATSRYFESRSGRGIQSKGCEHYRAYNEEKMQMRFEKRAKSGGRDGFKHAA